MDNSNNDNLPIIIDKKNLKNGIPDDAKAVIIQTRDGVSHSISEGRKFEDDEVFNAFMEQYRNWQEDEEERKFWQELDNNKNYWDELYKCRSKWEEQQKRR